MPNSVDRGGYLRQAFTHSAASDPISRIAELFP